MKLYTYPCDYGFCCITTIQKMDGDILCGIELGSTSEEAIMLAAQRFAPLKEKLFFEKHDDQFVAEIVSALNAGESARVKKTLITGTGLQQDVWRYLLQNVKWGQTISYQDLANAINKPGAVRAVASAVGENPIAVIVPCHRVVKSDGKHSGFRWGLDLKKKLLDREKKEVTF